MAPAHCSGGLPGVQEAGKQVCHVNTLDEGMVVAAEGVSPLLRRDATGFCT